MGKLLKQLYHFFNRKIKKVIFFFSVNWLKTLILNFRTLPFKSALKLPILIYGPVKLYKLKGKITINSPLKMGMIGLGQRFEMQTVHKGISEINLSGELIFNGHAHIGKDFFLHIGEKAKCEFGHMNMLGSSVKLICTNSIKIGDWTSIGYESQISDSNYHPTKNTLTGEYYPISKPAIIGEFNYVTNNVSIMPRTITPSNCVIASYSIVNKDYTGLGKNILLGGMPAKILKNNFARDWDIEKERLLKNLIKWQPYTDLL